MPFVLLDEILRGTNSDDKRNGTIEVVKKVIANKAIGAIATHIEVSDYKRVSGYSYQQMF
jgi:DNA mismatch repair ATPase MutS